MPLNCIDLTHSVDDDMPVYPGDILPSVKRIASVEDQGYNEIELHMSTHTGTHIDAPYHLIATGTSLDSFPVTKYIGKGIVIDCYQKSLITKDTILSSLSELSVDFVLLFTGWDAHWGTEKYFRNIPILDPEAAEYLSNLSLKGIGIDAPSFDPVGSTTLNRHNLFLGNNFILIENLTGLGDLLKKDFILSCFPLNIKNADGSPVRAVATIQD